MALVYWKSWYGDQIIKKAKEVEEQAVLDCAETILEESRAIVPLDTGELHDSSDTSIESFGNEVRATIFYDKEYARKMHEGVGFDFQQGRSAKYLEGPLKNFAGRWEQFLRRVIGKGF